MNNAQIIALIAAAAVMGYIANNATRAGIAVAPQLTWRERLQQESVERVKTMLIEKRALQLWERYEDRGLPRCIADPNVRCK